MVLQQMGCCAFNEIRQLSGHRSAKEAMREFCQQNFTNFGRRRLGAFYIFTAVVKSTRDASAGTYGEKFAKFIKDNNLGEVTPTMVRTNRRNVPTHHIQGWVWAPSEAKLKAWWLANGGSRG